MTDGYIKAKIKFLDHRIFILQQRIDKGGATSSLNEALKQFYEMRSDYRGMMKP